MKTMIILFSKIFFLQKNVIKLLKLFFSIFSFFLLLLLRERWSQKIIAVSFCSLSSIKNDNKWKKVRLLNEVNAATSNRFTWWLHSSNVSFLFFLNSFSRLRTKQKKSIKREFLWIHCSWKQRGKFYLMANKLWTKMTDLSKWKQRIYSPKINTNILFSFEGNLQTFSNIISE